MAFFLALKNQHYVAPSKRTSAAMRRGQPNDQDC